MRTFDGATWHRSVDADGDTMTGTLFIGDGLDGRSLVIQQAGTGSPAIAGGHPNIKFRDVESIFTTTLIDEIDINEFIITKIDPATSNPLTTMTFHTDGNISLEGGSNVPTDIAHLTRMDYVDAKTVITWLTPAQIGTGLSTTVGVPAVTELSSTDIAFADSTNGLLRTYRWNGSTWATVGNSLGIANMQFVGLATLNSSTIAYIDDINDQLRTYTFNGTSWSQVGNSFSVTGGASNSQPTLTALNSTDVAYADDGIQELRTYRWDGADWALLGNGLAIVGGARWPSLTTLNGTDVAFTDETNDELRTYRFDGTDWAQVGNSFDLGSLTYPMVAALNGTDVAYIDGTHDLLRTYRFDGTDWAATGSTLSITGAANPTMAALSGTDIAFIDSTDATDGDLRTYRFGATYGDPSTVDVLDARYIETNVGDINTNWIHADNGDDFDTAPAAVGTNAIAIGNFAQANVSNSIAIGTTVVASGTNSVSLGLLTDATGLDSLAIANGAQATATAAVALGRRAKAALDNQVCIGNQADTTTVTSDVTYSTKLGYGIDDTNKNMLHLFSKGKLELYGEEAQFVLPSHGSPATVTGVTGGLIYDSIAQEMKLYDGAAWNAVGGGGGVANPLTADLDTGGYTIITAAVTTDINSNSILIQPGSNTYSGGGKSAGSVNIKGGEGTNGNLPGAVNITGGKNTTSFGNGVNIAGGYGATKGGQVIIQGGYGYSPDGISSSRVQIYGGNSGNGNYKGGAVEIFGGRNGQNAGDGGDVTISGGYGYAGYTAGSVHLEPGNLYEGGTAGSVNVHASQGVSGQASVRLWHDTNAAHTTGRYHELAVPGGSPALGNVTFTLPADNGTANDVLITDGSGILSYTSDISVTAFSETANSIATTGAVTLDASTGTYFYNTATTGVITFTFSGAAASGRVTIITLELFGGGTNAPVWPASVDWPAATEPTWTTGVDVVTFITRDAGTTWLGMLGGTAFA